MPSNALQRTTATPNPAESWTHHRARIASLSRSRRDDDPELHEARRDLRAARLEDQVRKVVEDWPPLTEDQIDRLRSLLRQVG